MAPLNFVFDLKTVKKEIVTAHHASTQRGLTKSAKWLAEMIFALNDVQIDLSVIKKASTLKFKEKEYNDAYLMCKSYFDSQDYLRCAHFAEPYKKECNLLRFLRFYALYMDSEKKRLEDMTEPTADPNPKHMNSLNELLYELKASYADRNLRNYDPYDLYLLGMISRRLGNVKAATKYLVGCLHQNNLVWGAWIELGFLIVDKKHLESIKRLDFPGCWMYHIYQGYINLELGSYSKALRIFRALQNAGFHKSIYIKSQMAIAYRNSQKVDKALETFNEVCEEDPYRLDDMDVYSNILQERGEKKYLEMLVDKAITIDKSRPESSCIIGNLCRLTKEHHIALEYFRKALRMNPYNLSAWTLMGHQFIQLYNSKAAIQCYREAIGVNRHDYRALNALAKTYDMLRMRNWAMFYRRQAHYLRPNDLRLLTELGTSYERVLQSECARKCYERAKKLGDWDGQANVRMARMFRDTDRDKAATCYLDYLRDLQMKKCSGRYDEGYANIFLAEYLLSKDKPEDAFRHARKAHGLPNFKEEGTAMMTKIRDSMAAKVAANLAEFEVVEIAANDAEIEVVKIAAAVDMQDPLSDEAIRLQATTPPHNLPTARLLSDFVCREELNFDEEFRHDDDELE